MTRPVGKWQILFSSWGHLPFQTTTIATVLVYCLTLPGGRLVPLSWWGNRFLEMEYGMIYCCCSSQANDEITLKWYTSVEKSWLDDGWWCGSLSWGIMAMTVKYNHVIARPWWILQGQESWLPWPLGWGLRSFWLLSGGRTNQIMEGEGFWAFRG